MRIILPLAGALLMCAVPALWAQSPNQSAHDLVKDVVYNELQERRHVSLWQYREEKRVGSQTTIQQEVETRSGIVYRVLARQGQPLDPAAQKRETERLNNLLRNSAEQARMKQESQVEEQRLERLMTAMPEAFSYTYDGMVDGNLRLSFRPNPAYTPQTYENRAYHALAGEVWGEGKAAARGSELEPTLIGRQSPSKTGLASSTPCATFSRKREKGGLFSSDNVPA